MERTETNTCPQQEIFTFAEGAGKKLLNRNPWKSGRERRYQMKNVSKKPREVWWRERVRDLRGPLWRKDSVTYGREGEGNTEKSAVKDKNQKRRKKNQWKENLRDGRHFLTFKLPWQLNFRGCRRVVPLVYHRGKNGCTPFKGRNENDVGIADDFFF